MTFDAAVFFAQHLDLRPLRGRRRGLTHCRFHGEDRHPSLSVDLDRGLFNCFACGLRGGLRQFAELVGERSTVQASAYRRPGREPKVAWRVLLQRARMVDARRIAWLPWWRANDAVRHANNVVRHARRWAKVLGPDHPRTWPLLECAAATQRAALLMEAQLEVLLAEGRLGLDGDDGV